MDASEFSQLSAAQWALLREELGVAIDLPPTEAKLHLETRLAEDQLVRDCALSMLAADQDDSLSMTPLEVGRGEGIEVGPYITRRQIAVGGMGTVYLAARMDGEIQRLVALKIIRPHLGTTEILNRFRRERQVQANLDHPGIVRLLDGGATAEGHPYLVMEYVEGRPIDEYCDMQRLNVAERLVLFRRVVDAVSHAHQRLVVHRDLKPSNLLVTAGGDPKLLDFGIAKVLDPEKNSAEPEVTGLAMGFLTPAYASPEQVRGTEITTTSDLYSLGVLLYALLSGQMPYDLQGRSPVEIEKAICELEPMKVSRAACDHPGRGASSAVDSGCSEEHATKRRTTPADLVKTLRGDLDAIVAMCMRKEARRRYPSAASLGEDIDRFLAGKTVLARPDSWTYRTGKFVRRNRLVVSLAALCAVSVCAGLALSLRHNAALRRTGLQLVDQRDLAQDRLARLRSLRKDVVRAASRIHQLVPDALEEVGNLLRTVEHNLSQEAELASGDPEILREVAVGHIELGRIRYSTRSGNLGLTDEAERSFERAISALDQASRLQPGHSGLVHPYGEALDLLAGVKRVARDQQGALACYDRLLAICSAVEEGQRRASDVLGARCLANASSSRILRTLGRGQEAVDRAQTACDDWAASSPETPVLKQIREGQLAYLQLALGSALIDNGEFRRAHDILQLAEPVYLKVMGQHQGLGPSSNRSVFLRKRGRALQGQGADGAATCFQRAVASAEQVLNSTPTDQRARSLYRLSLYDYADFLLTAGEVEQASVLANEVWEQTRTLKEEFPALREAGHMRQIGADLLLGRLHVAMGDLVTGAEHLAGAHRSLEELERLGNWDWGIGVLQIETQLVMAELRHVEGIRTSGSQRARARDKSLALVARAEALLKKALSRGVADDSFRRLSEQARKVASKAAALD